MSKKVVAILSVLKPVDDTRNLEKIASSLGNTNKYDINIIGFEAKNLPDVQNITCHPLFNFDRLDIQRLFAPIKTLRILIKVRPELAIVTCPELLIVTCAYKILFGCKIIYDIQENYYRNIIHTSTYPKLLRPIIGLAIRGAEWATAALIDRFSLAEKVYQKQLTFIHSRFEVIENKAVIPAGLQRTQSQKKRSTTFLYSGTIAAHYGIFDAVNFIKQLHARNGDTELRIVGFAPDQKVLKLLCEQIADCDYIHMTGGNTLVPHHQVLNEIARADFCVLPYQPNESTEGRLPTKLFECLALETPVIITPNITWNNIITENNAGIIYDFRFGNLPIDQIEHNSYYGNNLADRYLWRTEASRLKQMVEQLI
jgi:glycosyltransferase involved in cell wall biosynthesis